MTVAQLNELADAIFLEIDAECERRGVKFDNLNQPGHVPAWGRAIINRYMMELNPRDRRRLVWILMNTGDEKGSDDIVVTA